MPVVMTTRKVRCKHSDPLCEDCKQELDNMFPDTQNGDEELNKSLDIALDEFERQLRVDISNHISGDKSRNAAFSHIDARKALEVIIKDRDTKRDAYVIGEYVEPKMDGKVVPRGNTVTIDMENNLRESCVFIEDNAKFVMQQEQHQRAKQWSDKS